MNKIVLNKDQKLWFTSDSHYGHTNICSAISKWSDITKCRTFKSLEHMNSYLVGSINECVAQDDILFHLGDWSFGGFDEIRKFREQIICKNVHIITGNHDHHIDNNKDNIRSIFSSINKYLNLTVKYHKEKAFVSEARFILMHFPLASWENMHKGSIHLHGHVHLPHDKKIGVGKMMDIGCDGNNYYPYEMTEIIRIMDKQPIKSMIQYDHHE